MTASIRSSATGSNGGVATATVPQPAGVAAGDLVIAQTANICGFLGDRHDLSPGTDGGRAEAMQLQLTISDLVAEAHDTHHPISSAQYYEDQRDAAALRAAAFRDQIQLGRKRSIQLLEHFDRIGLTRRFGNERKVRPDSALAS